MSTKPTDVATWATTGPITVPNSGKKAAGFAPAERAAAQHLNYLHNLAGLWQKYLDDLFDSSSDLILPANAYFQVSDTGQYKHGLRELTVDASAFVINVDGTSGATPVFHGDYWTVAGGIAELTAPILLPVGKRIVSLTYDYNWEGGSGLVDFLLEKSKQGTTSAPLDDKQISGSGSSWTSVNSNSGTINHTIATGYKMRVSVLSSNTSLRVGGFSVFYDEP